MGYYSCVSSSLLTSGGGGVPFFEPPPLEAGMRWTCFKFKFSLIELQLKLNKLTNVNGCIIHNSERLISNEH